MKTIAPSRRVIAGPERSRRPRPIVSTTPRRMPGKRAAPAGPAGPRDRWRHGGPGATAPDEPAEVGQPRRAPAAVGRRPRPPADPAAAVGRGEERPDRLRQLRLAEVADDPGPLDEADLAVLLGDDDDDRVGLLGDPEGRPVARPEPLGVDRHLGQRQEGAGGEDRLVADDHRPVVERRPRREDRAEQIGADVGVEHHAGLRDLLEAGLALEHDQRAVAVGRQQRRRPGDLVRDVVDGPLLGRREEPVERPDPADPLERAAKLRLEDDDEGEQADDGEGLEDLGEEPQVEGAGRGVDREQDADADHEADRAGPADQAEQPVDQERRDPDVDQRGQVDLVDDRLEKLRHRPPSLHRAVGPDRRASGRRAGSVGRRASGAQRGRPAARPRGGRRRARTAVASRPRRRRGRRSGRAAGACRRPAPASRGRGRARRGGGGGPGRTGRARSRGSRRRPRPTGGPPGGGRGRRRGGRRGPRRSSPA